VRSGSRQSALDERQVVVGERDGAVPVRGTQSFVYTMSACWRRPSLTALEVAWRWAFGAPAAWLIAQEVTRSLSGVQVDFGALSRISVFEPMAATEVIAQIGDVVLPPLLKLAAWLGPLLLVGWVVVSSLGRTVVLRRADRELSARPVTLMALQLVRMVALLGSFAVWFGCLRWAGQVAVNGPMARGQEPSLVLYCALTIVSTLGLFTLWAIVSWVFSVAPLLALLLNRGPGPSLAAAFRLGPVRSKLVEINLVMGIVKIALIVLAMVFSSCPLPFESVATPDFMLHWYVVVGILYFVASDFFHVVRLVAYLELWKTYNPARGL
jgi:hypothetical protein